MSVVTSNKDDLEILVNAVEFDEADLGDWEIYEPILAGLKVHNRIGIFFTVCLIWRRIILLFVAMFLDDYAWIQVIVFVYCSLFMCCFVAYSWPFIKATANDVELFNELMIMIVGVLAMVYVGLVRTPLEGYEVGEWMKRVIQSQIAINLALLIYKLAWNAKLRIKRWIA